MAASFTVTPEHYVKEFYAQLSIIDEFCAKNHIKYWAVGGTLLGQVRHQDFIPWDDDCDVGILEKDGEFMLQHLLPILQKDGKHDLWRSVHGLKLFSTTLRNAGTDVFFYKTRPDDCDVLELASEKSRKQWPKDFFFVNEIDGDLPKEPFGPISISIPRNAERYLKNVYGDTCLTHARLNGYDHLLASPRTGTLASVALKDIVLAKKHVKL